MTRNALGKGLGALIREPETSQQLNQPQPPQQQPAVQPPQGQAVAGTSTAAAATALAPASQSGTGIPHQVDIDLIDPNPYQPRTHFREEALEELARSIQSTGVIQPIVLRRKGARFQLIAGERRWRASQRAGLHKVPSILIDVPEEQALEITLVENLQREDLNAVEEARAYDRLMSEFQMTQEEVAEKTGKDRTTIGNSVRLLKLDQPVLDLLEQGKLTAAHARTLLGVADPALRTALATRVVRRGMTVRQLERFTSRRIRLGKKSDAAPAPDADPNTQAAINELANHLGTRVGIRPKTATKPGALIIEYYDDDQLAGIYDKIIH
jgi:ParB family transcriptional regulator, chromosome partitioning protein